MAQHVRQQVLDAAIAALKAGVPLVRERVVEDLDDEIDASASTSNGAGNLPCIVVRADRELIEQQHGSKKRYLRLTCIAYAASGSRLQTVLNDIAADMETVLDAGLTVSGKSIKLLHPQPGQAPAIELDYSSRLERKTGALAVTYFALYATAHGQPRQLL